MQFKGLAGMRASGLTACDGSPALKAYKKSVPREAFVPRSLTAGGAEARSGLVERLRGEIRAIEQAPVSLAAPPTVDTGAPRPACTSPEKTSAHTPSWTFGIEQIDQALPWAGLPSNGLHEIRPASHADSWAALGFALALLARRKTARGGILLWGFTERTAHEFGAPYAPGLSRFGIDPNALLMARARGGPDLAWVLEEGLKSRALDAVLGQGEAMPEAIGKRLALAARTHRTPCLLIPDHRAGGLGPALTRWRVAAAPSAPPPFNASAPGFPCWHLTLERCRHGPAGHEWTLEWQEAREG